MALTVDGDVLGEEVQRAARVDAETSFAAAASAAGERARGVTLLGGGLADE